MLDTGNYHKIKLLFCVREWRGVKFKPTILY